MGGVCELWCRPLGYEPKVQSGAGGSCLPLTGDFAHKIPHLIMRRATRAGRPVDPGLVSITRRGVIMKKAFWLAGAAILALAQPASAGDTIKIGFVSTFSGPTAVIGNDMRNSFELALDHLGRKMGGLPVEVIYEDDQLKPEVGVQKTLKLIESDKVNFVAGYIWSNVLLASLKPVIDSQTFLISANAGPSQIAGELCSPYFFSTSWQNDQTPMALGVTLNNRGVKRLFILAPNYAAGKDMAAGVKKTFKGEIVGEEYTGWPGQLDFSAELTKVRSVKPDAVWVFYPGQAGAQFMQQYAQAGLKDSIPIYS